MPSSRFTLVDRDKLHSAIILKNQPATRQSGRLSKTEQNYECDEELSENNVVDDEENFSGAMKEYQSNASGNVKPPMKRASFLPTFKKEDSSTDGVRMET